MRLSKLEEFLNVGKLSWTLSTANNCNSNNYYSNNLFNIVTHGVVAHSPELGTHDKSASQKKKLLKLKNNVNIMTTINSCR